MFAVADQDGSILGLYRMPDATMFSTDVAVAKARNTYYYASSELQTSDMIYNIVNKTQVGPALVPAGTAHHQSHLPSPGRAAFSRRHRHGRAGTVFQPQRAGDQSADRREHRAPLPASVYEQSTTPDYMYTSFVVGANFHDPYDPENQNGVVWFPGSSPLYLNTAGGSLLAAGFGTSGDGVDQDDVGTLAGQKGFAAPAMIRADQYLVHKVRLPFQKDDRNPNAL